MCLQTSHKYHNIKNPLLESLYTLKKNGMEVIGSFIIGLDGETTGAGERICAFIEQTDIPVTMLGVLQAAPHTSLWHRLEKEGRLRQDVGDDVGTFSALNYEPDRPEAEIMQEYVEAWDYLYEPSRYLARAYRYYLAMRPVRRDPAVAAGAPCPGPRPRPGHDLAPDINRDQGVFQNPLVARDPAVIPASVLDPVDRDVEAKPDPIQAIFRDLRRGRGPFRHEKDSAGKSHGHHQGAARLRLPAALQGRLAEAPLEPFPPALSRINDSECLAKDLRWLSSLFNFFHYWGGEKDNWWLKPSRNSFASTLCNRPWAAWIFSITTERSSSLALNSNLALASRSSSFRLGYFLFDISEFISLSF